MLKYLLIIGCLILMSLPVIAFSETIDVNGTTYHITNIEQDDFLEVTIYDINEFVGQYQPTTTGYAEYQVGRGIIYAEGTEEELKQRIFDINYSICVGDGECEPIPDLDSNTIHYEDKIVIAEDFVVNSRIYTGDTFEDINGMATTPTIDDRYEDITHSETEFGFGWLLKAIRDIFYEITGIKERIDELETREAQRTSCEKSARDWASYQLCMRGGLTP